MAMLERDPELNLMAEATLGSSDIPSPRTGERPAVYADRIGEWYAARISDQQRKEQGLFLTSLPVADLMGRRIMAEGQAIRVLDPAAGAGILCCAAVEALVARSENLSAIELVAYEIDSALIGPLQAVLDYLVAWCRNGHRVRVVVRIEATDFIMANAEAVRPDTLLASRSRAEGFDVVIANPPYFKIAKSDSRAAAVSDVVHGQPNIYALFMTVAAAVLRAGGDFVFITPRSFASGLYFRRFRTVFFDMIRPTWIHVFGSRRDAFRRDEVLQENVVFSGVRQDGWCESAARVRIAISSCLGIEDIEAAVNREMPANMVLDPASVDKILRLPTCEDDEDVLALVDSWPTSLHDLGLNISTGPVVAFRAAGLTARDGKVPASHVPLLWMNHVRAMQITWPLNRHKPEYISRAGAEALLVPNRNYVFLRRFSAKEEARRLTAAPWVAAESAIPDVGLENHLNYIHRPGGTLLENEVWGLAALYNSSLLNTWFRAVNGNTQVSATELRAMPLPARETILALGHKVKRLANPMAQLDALVANLIISPALKEAAAG